MTNSTKSRPRSWTITLVRKLLRTAAHDPKKDTLWRLMTDETHPDAHKAMVCRAILDIHSTAGLEENRKNLILVIRHAVTLWLKMYSPDETGI
jgi:hypothetical protein